MRTNGKKNSIQYVSAFMNIESPEDIFTYDKEIVYFGRKTCPSCQLAERILVPYLESNKLTVLYFDTDEWRNHNLFKEILDEYNINKIPTIVKIIDGVCTDSMVVVDEESRIDIKLLEDFLMMEIS